MVQNAIANDGGKSSGGGGGGGQYYRYKLSYLKLVEVFKNHSLALRSAAVTEEVFISTPHVFYES